MKIEMRYDYATVRSEFTPRSPLRRKVMHNTYLHRDSAANDAPIMLLYHATDIITWSPANTIKINTDGWHTSTTKLRLNEYLSPLRIYQERGQWFWHYQDMEARLPFTDGDCVMPAPDGWRLATAVGPDKAEAEMRERRKLQAKVRKYANLYAKHMPFKWGDRKGDCWHCSQYLAGGAKLSKHVGSGVAERTAALGEIDSNRNVPREAIVDHFMTHMDEGYVMASVCYNALTYPGIGVAPAYFWVAFTGPEGQTFPDHDGWLKKRVCKCIAKYLRIQLGLVR